MRKTSNRKTFVLDTNILLQSPNAIFAFDDNKVVITEAVLEELDKFKKDKDDKGVNARATTRILEQLRTSNKKKLTEGITINSGKGLLKIETNHQSIELPPNWDIKKADHRILQVCKALLDDKEEVHLVTNDLLLRIKADILGILAEGYNTDAAPVIDKQYTGRKVIYIRDDDFNKFIEEKSLPIYHLMATEYINEDYIKVKDFYPNEFLILNNSQSNTVLAKVDAKGKHIIPLQYAKYNPYGLKPKNVGQKFAIEALMSDVPLILIKGRAGTAKTTLSVAAGLDFVMEQNKFRRMLICRPAQQMSEDLGFLPGDEKEKIAPYMRPIFDSLEVLVDSDSKERYANEETLKNKIRYIFDKEYIDMQAVAFLRGRSIVQQYVLIDEAQNITITQAKAIVTRAGEGTKIVICGDPDQIDTPYLDTTNNGLSWLSEKMKGSSYCAQITMEDSECVRSKLAEDAIGRLI